MNQPKKGIAGIILLVSMLMFVCQGCKKKRAFKEEDGQTAVDIFNFTAENDAALNDINAVMADQSFVRGKGEENVGASSVTICGALVDTSAVFNGVLTLRYTGTVCNNRKREGKILITVQNYPTKKWKQKNCVVKLDFQAFRITNTVDNKVMQIDGTEYLTNESGGTWYDLKYLNQGSLVYALTGNDIAVHFDQADVAIYNVGRKVTYTYPKSTITCSWDGTGVQGDKTGLECWGQTRTGDEFTSQVISPLTWSTICGTAWPISGELDVKAASKDFTLNLLFGTDSFGTSFYSEKGQCAYGWRMKWSYKRSTNKRVFGYQ